MGGLKKTASRLETPALQSALGQGMQRQNQAWSPGSDLGDWSNLLCHDTHLDTGANTMTLLRKTQSASCSCGAQTSLSPPKPRTALRATAYGRSGSTLSSLSLDSSESSKHSKRKSGWVSTSGQKEHWVNPCLFSGWALGVALAFAVILGFHTVKIAGCCTHWRLRWS